MADRKFRMSGGGNPRGVSAEGSDPLEAFKKIVEKRKKSNKRVVRLRLLPEKHEEEILFDIGLTSVRLWNELNYEKRQLFFKNDLKPEKRVEINRKYYHKYKKILGVNAGQVINKNEEAWNSFFELLKMKRQGRLSPHIRKISPPGYWKDRITGKKKIHILIRNDRYYLETVNEGEGRLILKDFKLSIRYVGRIRWEGKQGRLEIIYEADRWFAYIPIEVGVDPPKSNLKGYIKPNYKDKKNRIFNPRSIKQRDPIGDKKAFIDVGLNNLFAVVVSDGSALLVKGGTIKSEYYWWKREISTYQAVRDLLKNAGISTWMKYHEKYLRALYKRNERLRHLYRTAIRFLAEMLWSRGVEKIYVGYPIMLSQNNGNEYNNNIWWYRKIILWMIDVFIEYGIDIEIVSEDYTSIECSICEEIHRDGRIYRGLYICRKTNKKINADINAALNIAGRIGYKIIVTRKIESYLVSHNGVKPLIPLQRANTRDPEIRNLAL
ncbi:transposase [Thermoproteus sp. CP80]|uniref:transposase n=1 Tax=Thermoproteus sp. CP80 TaxID=1650659 RepID=UPI001EDD868D|nr:transposase [Thermoproteus sp. CP80]